MRLYIRISAFSLLLLAGNLAILTMIDVPERISRTSLSPLQIYLLLAAGIGGVLFYHSALQISRFYLVGINLSYLTGFILSLSWLGVLTGSLFVLSQLLPKSLANFSFPIACLVPSIAELFACRKTSEARGKAGHFIAVYFISLLVCVSVIILIFFVSVMEGWD